MKSFLVNEDGFPEKSLIIGSLNQICEYDSKQNIFFKTFALRKHSLIAQKVVIHQKMKITILLQITLIFSTVDVMILCLKMNQKICLRSWKIYNYLQDHRKRELKGFLSTNNTISFPYYLLLISQLPFIFLVWYQ